jgi:hypothetical protein
MQYNFIVGYVAMDKNGQLINIFDSTTPNDDERQMSSLHKVGILENWIRINYSNALSNKYPEAKEAIGILDEFQIKED